MEYETHKAVVTWPEREGEEAQISDEKRVEIEQAVKNLIHVLDRTEVVAITFSKIETDEEKTNTESGSGN